MLEVFTKDFWAISRENKGYYAWVSEYKYALSRAVRSSRCCRMCDEPGDAREQVDALLETGLSLHPLLDVAFDAISRAETRLSLRFVPQRSNEERLTGHLISEIEAAIHLASPSFSDLSQKRYGEHLMLDFSYLDLSRGGHDEKLTGGDFGIILSIDLPDRPKMLRSIAVQAKKLDRYSQVNKIQFDTLVKNYGEGAAYVFYDMNFETLAPPMVINASDLVEARGKDDETESFSLKKETIFRQGTPLSLWLFTQLASGRTGCVESSLEGAINSMKRPFNASKNHLLNENLENHPSVSRLALISVGKSFESSVNNNESYTVRFKK